MALRAGLFEGLHSAGGAFVSALCPLVLQNLIQHWKARGTSSSSGRTWVHDLDGCALTVIVAVASVVSVLVVAALQLHGLLH